LNRHKILFRHEENMKVKIKNAKIAVDRMDRAREDNNQRYLDRMKFGIETHISLEEQKKAIQI